MKGLKFCAIILFIIAGIMFYKGYDKMTNYYSSEYYSQLNVNAYVGGDAYNYIINGNYATGFFVLGIGSCISGFICLGASTIIDAITNKELLIPSNVITAEPSTSDTLDNSDTLPPL